MGCPDISYKIMCQRFDKLIYSRKDIDLSADIKELENRIQSKEHTPEYYFNAGVIARGYLDEIHKNGDAVNTKSISELLHTSIDLQEGGD